MSSFWKSKPKSPQELVKCLKETIPKLDHQGDKKKVNEEISKTLVLIKGILYGEVDTDPSPELVAQLSQEIYNNDILPLLIQYIGKFEFEVNNPYFLLQAKKDVSQIFNNLLRRQIGSRFPTAEYILTRKEILQTLSNSYENQEVALNCGMVLRECIRHEALAKNMLDSPYFWKFFEYVDVSTFDVASDAFATFKDLLSRHKSLVAGFLERNFDVVCFCNLCSSFLTSIRIHC
jgi:calcium binding protein 39